MIFVQGGDAEAEAPAAIRDQCLAMGRAGGAMPGAAHHLLMFDGDAVSGVASQQENIMAQSKQEVAGANIVGSPKSKLRGPGPQIMAAGTLEGNDVCNSDGETLGSIQDIMLDVPHGRIAYAVLSRGGILGIGDKLYAIPWGALTLDTDKKRFVLDVSVDRFKKDEGFDKDDWPAMADDTWARQTYASYGQVPYW